MINKEKRQKLILATSLGKEPSYVEMVKDIECSSYDLVHIIVFILCQSPPKNYIRLLLCQLSVFLSQLIIPQVIDRIIRFHSIFEIGRAHV